MDSMSTIDCCFYLTVGRMNPPKLSATLRAYCEQLVIALELTKGKDIVQVGSKQCIVQ